MYIASLCILHTGADPGGGVMGVRTPKLQKEGEKTSRTCARMGRILVLNSYVLSNCFHM